MNQTTGIEKLSFGLLTIIFGLSIYIGINHPDYFHKQFAAEDGLVEYGTALMLLFIALLCIYRLFRFSATKKWLWSLGVLGFAALFLFGAGEEISWGQRIFEIESSEFFKTHNSQKETNLHNLVVGETKLNILIFSQLLIVVLSLYLFAAPVLYRKWKWITQLSDMFAVPIPQWQHSIAFTAATLLVLLIPAERKWEVYELAFGLLFFLIFLNPWNKHIFKT